MVNNVSIKSPEPLRGSAFLWSRKCENIAEVCGFIKFSHIANRTLLLPGWCNTIAVILGAFPKFHCSLSSNLHYEIISMNHIYCLIFSLFTNLEPIEPILYQKEGLQLQGQHQHLIFFSNNKDVKGTSLATTHNHLSKYESSSFQERCSITVYHNRKSELVSLKFH